MRSVRAWLAALILASGLLLAGAAAPETERVALTLEAGSTVVQAGQEAQFLLALEEGADINVIKGTLEYDQEIFELPSQEDFEPLGGWESVFYNPDSGQFILFHRGAQPEPGDVLSIRLAAKGELTAGSARVGVTGLAVSGGDGDVAPGDVEVTLSLLSTPLQAEPEEESQQEQLENAPDGEEEPVRPEELAQEDRAAEWERAGTGQGSEEEGQAGEDGLPWPLLTACVVAAVLALVILSVLWRRKGKRSGGKLAMMVFAALASAAVAVGGAYAFSGRGDLNGDGEVDYHDIHLLQKHLIALSLLPEETWDAADLDTSGDLTVNDLSLLIRRVEKNVNYTVELTSAMDRVYHERQEEIVLKFSAQVSHGGQIRQVTVNDVQYEAEPAGGDGGYMVRIPGRDAAGVYALRLSKLHLHSGQEVDVEHTEQIGVLKTAPWMEQFLIEETDEPGQVTLCFALQDEDSALLDARMEVFRNEADGFVLVEEREVSAGENRIALELEEDASYTIHLAAWYDRAHGSLESQEDHTGSLAVTQEYQFTVDYQFSFYHLRGETETGEESTTFSKGQPVVLRFESGNATRFQPAWAVVDGQSYPVERSGDGYRIVLDGFTQMGEREITVERVVLENGKAFDLAQDNSLTVRIRKEAPAVAGLSVTEGEALGQLQIAFRLDDPDGSLSNQVILIRDADGTLVGQRFLTEDELGQDGFSDAVLLQDPQLTAAYTVQVAADRDLSGDGSELERQVVLAEQTIQARPRVVIQAGSAREAFVEKGGTVELTYEIADNVEAELLHLVVNHMPLEAERLEGEAWKVTAAAGCEAGKQSFALSQLLFADGTAVEVSHGIAVEVMRSAPAAENYEAQDMLEQERVRFLFDLTDGDGAFLSGRAELVGPDGGIVDQQLLTEVGRQEIIFDVEERQAYTFRVLATWSRTQDGGDQVSDDVLLERPVYLIRDYGLRLSELDTFLEDGTQAVYFEAGSAVIFRFRAETATALSAVRAQVNGVEYDLTALGEGSYELTLEAPDMPGVQALAIETLTLENGKQLAVEQGHSVQVEVLKAAPSVTEFAWEQTDQDELKVRFVLEDADSALLGGQTSISLEDGTPLASQPLAQGENELTAALTVQEGYVVSVTADYDRDTNALDGQSNHYSNQQLFTTSITLSRDGIQFKDVTAHRLYRSGDGGVQEIAVLDVTGGLPADVERYYAVLEMAGLPDFYAGIREFRRDESGRVYAVLDQEDVVFYTEDGARQSEYTFPLSYRDGAGEHPLITSAEELLRQMAANPKGSYRLTEDLDASGLSDAAAAIAGTFSGELDGNGHRILNLPTSLFQTLSGAYVHDLVIENAQITTQRSGILANVIQNQSVVERVFIVDSSISNGVDQLGAFAGNLNNSTIRESASINVSVKGLVAVGGIVGKTNAGALIENCYATGKVQGTYDHPTLGARVGGIAGWHGGGTIRACFTQVQVIAPAKKGNGGIIGGPNTGSPVIEDSLSMSTGAGYRIAGFDVLGSVKNVYEYAGSGSETNITPDNQDQVRETDAVFDRLFYTGTLGWDEGLWDLDLLAYGKRPNLKAAPNTDNNYGIPNYAQVRGQAGYRPDREQAYANLAKLAPFSDVRVWVEYGNQLPEGNALVTQAVDFILPLGADGALVTGVHRDAPGAVEQIRVVFENQSMEEYAVSWRKAMGGIVSAYQVDGLETPYQFHRYLAGFDGSLLEEAAALASGLDYPAQIAALTDEEESRLYVDYYNEQVRPRVEKVVWDLLAAAYPTYCETGAVQALVRAQLLEEDSWKELLYAYNYYDKWYRIDYSGVVLSDLLFFSGELLAERMTTQALTDRLLAAPSTQRETNRTVVFYNSALKDYTGVGLSDFLGGLAQSVAGYSDPSDWFAANFDGILKEQAPLHNADTLNYRIWDILSGLDDGRKSILLPILTAPQEDMYLISMPSQLMLGSMNRYPTYLTKDGGERQRMEEIIDTYTAKMGIFYGVSSNWIDNSAQILNNFVHIHYDTRLNFPASEAADAGDQDKDKTRDPVMKWVYEANNTISAKNGSAASADGTNVYWMIDAALGTSDYSFFTFSHENAHNQDGRYFYDGAGRRRGTGGEAHADGNIAQEHRDGCMVFNISKINDLGVEMTNNFSFQRIDSPEKLWSYYREMLETGYVLDYLAAQAFLRLTPEEQAAVAVQAVHTPGGTDSFTTTYRALTAEELRQMDLRDLDDLWEHKLSIRGSLETVGTATAGSYGFESFYCMNWYQPHNDDGSPDTHSFKRLGMEMLGVGGYEAYQIYMSARSASDLDALRQITGQEDITWRDYKLSRFQTVAANLDRIPYFEAETVIRQFQEAFQRDAQNGTRSEGMAVKRMLYGIVKRATGDFSDGGIYDSPQVIAVTSAEELIRLAAENPYGFYRLEADLDFTGIAAPQGSYLPGRFIGVLDGNGHALTGMEYPLFGDLQYAQVTDLSIVNPAFATGAQAMLAVKAKQAVVGGVTVQGLTAEDAARQLPLVRTKTNTYYEYGTAIAPLEEIWEELTPEGEPPTWGETSESEDEMGEQPGETEEQPDDMEESESMEELEGTESTEIGTP